MTTVCLTALFGDCDRPKPAPLGVDRAICYVERPRPELAAFGWTAREVSVGDHRRQAWRLRCQAHHYCPDADCILWLDASFISIDIPGLLADAGDHALVGFQHPHRTSCYEEGPALVAENRATVEGTERQLDTYRAEGFLPTALTGANVLLRRRTPAVLAFNDYWLDELDRWPEDNAQLSLDYCAWKAGLSVHYLTGTYIDNPYVMYDHADHRSRWQPYR